MDFSEMRRRARARIGDAAWSYYQASADDDVTTDPGTSADPLGDPALPDPTHRDPGARDTAAWRRISLIPRILTGTGEPDTSTHIEPQQHRGGAGLRTPVMVAATAAHRMAHPDGEIATGRAAAAAGALMVYSNSATVDVTTFGAAMPGPWWAQVYVHRNRARSNEYLDRAAEAGAGAIVLTADLRPGAADSPFRRTIHPPARLGNYPDLPWQEVSSRYDPALVPDVIGEIASRTGLPVHVKGVLAPVDALRAVDAGAAGVIVSNHGRRQLAGVIPTAEALGPVVDAVAGRVPVLVDGGIRSGTDAVRALTLGADLVGVGRPVLWALAADGEQGVADLLAGLTAELAQSLAAMGADDVRDVGRSSSGA